MKPTILNKSHIVRAIFGKLIEKLCKIGAGKTVTILSRDVVSD